jgi:hypothetical protein
MSDARPNATGTIAQVRSYWRGAYPKAVDRALRSRERHGMAQEVFPHLSSTPPTVEGVCCGRWPLPVLHGGWGLSDPHQCSFFR